MALLVLHQAVLSPPHFTTKLRPCHHVAFCSCSYLVSFINEYFMETDLHLQISQHQATLKHENFTLSYHGYTTLLPQNILQLQLHFSGTLYSISNMRFILFE